jgi:putative oxidoreductase
VPHPPVILPHDDDGMPGLVETGGGMQRRRMSDTVHRLEAEAYALFRIVTGFLFICHGLQKVFGLFGGTPVGAPPFIVWTAGPLELGCGLLVMLGLYTRPAAFLASGLMAVAYWIGHGSHALFPIQNQGELAVAYCFVFLFISARGAGKWSVGS